MAGQQQQIIDTIFNMKRKMLRRERDDCTAHLFLLSGAQLTV